MNLRILRDVLVLLVLAMLPPLIAGCATAVRGNQPRMEPGYAPSATAGIRPGGGFAGGGGGFGGQAPGASGMSYLVPRQSLPAPQEELWVIQKHPDLGREEDTQSPGTGSMVMPRGDSFVPIPLKHTDVRATISGYVGTVDVTQQFHNPYSGKIEAVYVFPLPHNAAVNEFVMTVGDRHIRGVIREREEAKQIYEQAKGQGYVTSLLEQDRPNVFTQRVANIEPGKQIDVSVRYFHT